MLSSITKIENNKALVLERDRVLVVSSNGVIFLLSLESICICFRTLAKFPAFDFDSEQRCLLQVPSLWIMLRCLHLGSNLDSKPLCSLQGPYLDSRQKLLLQGLVLFLMLTSESKDYDGGSFRPTKVFTCI